MSLSHKLFALNVLSWSEVELDGWVKYFRYFWNINLHHIWMTTKSGIFINISIKFHQLIILYRSISISCFSFQLCIQYKIPLNIEQWNHQLLYCTINIHHVCVCVYVCKITIESAIVCQQLNGQMHSSNKMHFNVNLFMQLSHFLICTHTKWVRYHLLNKRNEFIDYTTLLGQ